MENENSTIDAPSKVVTISFRKELTNLINKHSRENESNTPDFILAEYLMMALDAFNTALDKREYWYGQEQGD